MKTLRIVAIDERVSEEVKKSKGNGGRYRVVTLEGPGQILITDELGATHISKVPKKKTAITVWVDSPIPNRTESDYLHDANVGDVIPGQIVEREVMDYFIPIGESQASGKGVVVVGGIKGRYASTASVPVFGISDDTEDFELQIMKTFRQRNFILKGKGNAGAPGGTIEQALKRDQTKDEGANAEVQLPKALQEQIADNPDSKAEIIGEYAAASAEANEDPSANAR